MKNPRLRSARHSEHRPAGRKADQFRSWSESLRSVWLVTALVAGAANLCSAQESQPWTLPADWIPPAPTGFIAEPILMRQVINSTDASLHRDGQRDPGPYAEFGNMVSGAGWLSIGPGYRGQLLDGLAQYDVSAAMSSGLYKAVQGRFESSRMAPGRLLFGAQMSYQDLRDVHYYGRGSESAENERASYRLRDIDLLGYATVKATPWLSVNGRYGWLRTAELLVVDGPGTDRPGSDAHPEFIHADISVEADVRDHQGHPTSGGLYRASLATYIDRGFNNVRRYEVEGSQFIPLVSRNWVVALHAWGVLSDAATGGSVPFYLMPSLGGQNTLRGYANYRFHDNHLELLNAESRWALLAHLDVAVFVDAGKVAAHTRELDFRHLKSSYGAGLRLHNTSSTLLRLDCGRSDEGWRIAFTISDPFKRSTPASGRSSVIPFVP